jgi:hypothetical protein
MSQSVERLSAGPEYFNPQRSWFYVDGKVHSTHTHGVCHNASAFTRWVWGKVGGYPEVSGPQDALMDAALKSGRPGVEALVPHLGMNFEVRAKVRDWAESLPDHGVRVAPALTEDRVPWSYVYCWSRGFHLSGNADTESAYRSYGDRAPPPGRYEIEPRWRTQFLDLVALHLRQ